MKKLYVRISITYYSHKYIRPMVHYYKNDGVHPAINTFNELTIEQANRMMWELVNLGAKNKYHSNHLRSSICTREVTFFGYL